MANLREDIRGLKTEIEAWAGVSSAAHRFGGFEFLLGKREIGHIHLNGMVDIPYVKTIKTQLIAEGKAEPHHLLEESGWITFYMRQHTQRDHVMWLFRLSYLHKLIRQHQGELTPDIAAEIRDGLEALKLSAELDAIFKGLLGGRVEDE